MASKEFLVEMYNISISNIGTFEKTDRLRVCFNKIADDLDKLEQYEKIFKEPLRDIRKDLKLLEILKKWFMQHTMNYLEFDNTFYTEGTIREYEPIFKILKEWLDESKC